MTYNLILLQDYQTSYLSQKYNNGNDSLQSHSVPNEYRAGYPMHRNTNPNRNPTDGRILPYALRNMS